VVVLVNYMASEQRALAQYPALCVAHRDTTLKLRTRLNSYWRYTAYVQTKQRN
jgi:hypothetical protein